MWSNERPAALVVQENKPPCSAMITTVLLLLFTVLCALLSADHAWDNVTKPERNALVFDGRHRGYGAFMLRREYDRRFLLAFAGAAGLVGGALLLPQLLITSGSAHLLAAPKVVDVTLADQPIDIPKASAQPKVQHVAKPPAPIPPARHTETIVTVIDSAVVDDHKKPDAHSDPGTTGPDHAGGGAKPGPTDGGDKGSLLGTWKEPIDMAGVDSLPEFIGGMGAMTRFVQDHIRFPEDDPTTQKEWIEFVVDVDGSVMAVRAKGRAQKAFSQAAEQVVKSMPKWKPAMRKGEKVACRLVLPIDFRTK